MHPLLECGDTDLEWQESDNVWRTGDESDNESVHESVYESEDESEALAMPTADHVAVVHAASHASSKADESEDDDPMAGPAMDASLSDRARRRTALIRASLGPHRRVQSPPHEARWADGQVRVLIGLTGVTEENNPELFALMYEFPILALILLSNLCTNWWCGVAALWLTETLADKFPETRSLPGQHDLFVNGLREMTENIMRCFENRVSRAAFPLDPYPKSEAKRSLVVIKQMIDELFANGVLPAHRAPPQQWSPPPPQRCMPSPLRHPAQATSTSPSTRTCASLACPRSSSRSTVRSTPSAA